MVRACIDGSLNTCSETAVAEIELQYSEMVAAANVSCVEDFQGCAIKYVHYVIQIIEWKAYVEPEVEVVSAETEQSADTEATATAKSEKSKKTAKSEKTADTEKTASGTADTKATGTADTKATGTADTKATGTADTKATGTADTKATGTADTKTTGTADTASADTGEASGTAGSEKDMTVKEVQTITADRKETLTILCGQLTAAWECVQAEWSVLKPSSYELVYSTYTIYHSIVMGVCNGRVTS